MERVAPYIGARDCIDLAEDGEGVLGAVLPYRFVLLLIFVPLTVTGSPGSRSPVSRADADRERLRSQGKELIDGGKYERALEVYSRLIRANPEETNPHRKYQDCLVLLDRAHEARRQYRGRLRAAPTRAQNWYLMGRLLDRDEEARRHFEEATRLEPTYAWGYYGLAHYWANEEAHDEAIRLLRIVLELGLEERDAYYLAGWSYEELGMPEQAISAYRRYLRDADADEVHYIRNKIKLLQGDFSTILAYVVVAFGPVLGWFWYIRRKRTIGSVSWQNSLMLVIAGAVFSAFLLTDWLYGGVHRAGETEFMSLHPLPHRLARHFLVVGPVEEFSKWIFVMLLAYWTRFIRDPLDGVICGACVAIGFAWVENVQYMFRDGWGLAISRGAVCVPTHMVFSGLWGYGLGLARITPNKKKAWLGMGLSLMAGAFFHGLYNASIEFRRWQNANELTLYAGLATPVVVYLLVRIFRRHLMLARLWTAFYRRSLTLKREVAGVVDWPAVHKACKLRPDTTRGRKYWSATVNVVAQNVMRRLARTLPEGASERVGMMLSRPGVKSREVYALLREIGGVDEVIASECRELERQMAAGTGSAWRDKWRNRRLRKRIRWQMDVESMPGGPVRILKR